MIRFVPGEIGHVARKVIIYPSAEGGELQTAPPCFAINGTDWKLDQETLRVAWDLASSIFGSICPAGFEPVRSRLGVPAIPRATREFETIQACLVDSGGPWTKGGQRVDRNKYVAVGPFDHQGGRDFFGWAFLLPGVGAIIGGPQTDRSKVFTVLSSDRESITTQIYADGKWTDLPLSNDSMVVFPSLKLSKELGLQPPIQRVLIEKRSRSGTRRPNLTLVLSIIDRPASP